MGFAWGRLDENLTGGSKVPGASGFLTACRRARMLPRRPRLGITKRRASVAGKAVLRMSVAQALWMLGSWIGHGSHGSCNFPNTGLDDPLFCFLRSDDAGCLGKLLSTLCKLRAQLVHDSFPEVQSLLSLLLSLNTTGTPISIILYAASFSCNTAREIFDCTSVSTSSAKTAAFIEGQGPSAAKKNLKP